MPEKRWIKPFGPFALLVRRVTENGRVKSFSVVLIVFDEGRWTDISRYDTAHGYAHRDVLGRNEGLRGKLKLPNMTVNEAFRYAIRDLEKNATVYLADYEAH